MFINPQNNQNKQTLKQKLVEIVFITSNSEKKAVAQRAFSSSTLSLAFHSIHCPEIQSDHVEEIASQKSLFACETLGKPVIASDTGLFIPALKGFPGPYSSYIERHLTAEQILALMVNEVNREAYYLEAIAYCHPGDAPTVFKGYTKGTISFQCEGQFGAEFDRIFKTAGDPCPMACFPDEERVKRYETSHWFELLAHVTTL